MDGRTREERGVYTHAGQISNYLSLSIASRSWSAHAIAMSRGVRVESIVREEHAVRFTGV